VSRPRKLATVAVAVLLVSSSAGCGFTVRRHDWSQYEGPGAEYFHQQEVDALDFSDPVEPMNRGVWAANHAFLIGIVDPLAYVYRGIVPAPVRNAVNRFATNILYPRHLLTNLLQGKLAGAWHETERFAVNTTVGIAGFFDPATKWGIPASREDFGQTFAAWGWLPSTYLVLPFFGPSTVRDGVGLIPDTLTNPATYFFPTSSILTFNELSDFVARYKRLSRTAYDPYVLAQLLWILNRETQAADYAVKSATGPAAETLRVIFLSYRDPKFLSRMKTASVPIASTGRSLPYSYWMQDGPAPVLYIVPGLGTHRQGSSTLGLAEMAYSRGFSVVTISNAMNWEFIENASSVGVPGHAPVDAHDVHIALDAIDRDLGARFPGRATSRALMGYSLGAFHAFFIAAAEQNAQSSLIRFDRYIALDVPVRLLRGMEELDHLYNAPLELPVEERKPFIENTIRKALTLGSGELEPAMELPFSQQEAEFLIGLSFRLTLQQVIDASRAGYDAGVLESERTDCRRAAAYEETFDYSYMEYFYAFVLPYYLRNHAGMDDPQDLIAANDLRSIETAVHRNGKIRVFANRNDFLLGPEDIAWLTGTLGADRVRLFPTGGHLGNLHQPDVQREIMDSLSDLLPPQKRAQVEQEVSTRRPWQRSITAKRATPDAADVLMP